MCCDTAFAIDGFSAMQRIFLGGILRAVEVVVVVAKYCFAAVVRERCCMGCARVFWQTRRRRRAVGRRGDVTLARGATRRVRRCLTTLRVHVCGEVMACHSVCGVELQAGSVR